MSRKIALEIVALSHSIAQSQSYAVVLGEVEGSRRLPIVIGGFEAQAIAVGLERMQPTRPLTHDLFKNFFLAYGIELAEIVITDLQQGIFYAKLVCVTDNDTIELDSRTSDALALAVRFGCPIYTFEHILDSAGVMMEQDGTIANAKPESVGPSDSDITGNDLKSMSLEELDNILKSAIEQEDYVKAILIRDEINSRNK